MTDEHHEARVTVTRRAPTDIQSRQVIVSLDGKPFGTLLFGESETKPLPPGPHALRFNNTLVWKTVEFVAAPGEHVRFNVINRPGWGTWWMLSLLGTGPLYLTVTRE